MTARIASTAAALFTAAALAAPAHASFPLSPHGAVRVTSWGTTSATVCAWGLVDDGVHNVGVWTFTVGGVRADGVPPAGVGAPDTDADYYGCVTVTTGALASAFDGTLTYAGAGTTDPVGVAGVVAWRTSASGPNHIHYTTSG